MIAFAKKAKRKRACSDWQAAFLRILPAIRRYARFAFRGAPSETLDDLVEEVIANAFVAYARLVKAGKRDAVFPSALARFAISQILTGRRVGNRLRIRDVMSGYAQHHKAFCVARLDHFDSDENQWQVSSSKTGALGPPRSLPAGSTFTTGSACSLGDERLGENEIINFNSEEAPVIRRCVVVAGYQVARYCLGLCEGRPRIVEGAVLDRDRSGHGG